MVFRKTGLMSLAILLSTLLLAGCLGGGGNGTTTTYVLSISVVDDASGESLPDTEVTVNEAVVDLNEFGEGTATGLSGAVEIYAVLDGYFAYETTLTITEDDEYVIRMIQEVTTEEALDSLALALSDVPENVDEDNLLDVRAVVEAVERAIHTAKLAGATDEEIEVLANFQRYQNILLALEEWEIAEDIISHLNGFAQANDDMLNALAAHVDLLEGFFADYDEENERETALGEYLVELEHQVLWVVGPLADLLEGDDSEDSEPVQGSDFSTTSEDNGSQILRAFHPSTEGSEDGVWVEYELWVDEDLVDMLPLNASLSEVLEGTFELFTGSHNNGQGYQNPGEHLADGSLTVRMIKDVAVSSEEEENPIDWEIGDVTMNARFLQNHEWDPVTVDGYVEWDLTTNRALFVDHVRLSTPMLAADVSLELLLDRPFNASAEGNGEDEDPFAEYLQEILPKLNNAELILRGEMDVFRPSNGGYDPDPFVQADGNLSLTLKTFTDDDGDLDVGVSSITFDGLYGNADIRVVGRAVLNVDEPLGSGFNPDVFLPTMTLEVDGLVVIDNAEFELAVELDLSPSGTQDQMGLTANIQYNMNNVHTVTGSVTILLDKKEEDGFDPVDVTITLEDGVVILALSYSEEDGPSGKILDFDTEEVLAEMIGDSFEFAFRPDASGKQPVFSWLPAIFDRD